MIEAAIKITDKTTEPHQRGAELPVTMLKKLDIATWDRKEHFHFFKQFEEPFFGICTEVDCTLAYQQAKALQTSFFLYYLHKSIVAVNHV